MHDNLVVEGFEHAPVGFEATKVDNGIRTPRHTDDALGCCETACANVYLGQPWGARMRGAEARW